MMNRIEQNLERIEKKMRFLDYLADDVKTDLSLLCKQAGITLKILERWQHNDQYFAFNVTNYLTVDREEADDRHYMLLINRSHQGDTEAMIEYLMWKDKDGDFSAEGR